MKYYSQRETDSPDLETIFTKFYGADELTGFVQQIVLYLHDTEELSHLLKQSPFSSLPKKPIKKHRIKLLIDIFFNQQLLAYYHDSQTEECKRIMELLVWYGPQTLQLLEQRFSTKFSTVNTGRRQHWEPFHLLPGLEIFLLAYHPQYHAAFGNDKSKEEVRLYLPPAIHDLLHKSIPKPAAYTLSPVKQRKRREFTHSAEKSILLELTRMTEFISQGHCILRKNGTPTIKGLRDLAKIANLKEFYVDDDTPKSLEHLKASMHASFLLDSRLPQNIVNSEPHIVLQELFLQWIENDAILLFEEFLPHLREKYSNHHYSNSPYNIKKNLRALLTHLLTDNWFEVDTLIDFCTVRQIHLAEQKTGFLDFHYCEDNDYGSWASWRLVTNELFPSVVIRPTLQAFFFFMGALGVVEIAYDTPENSSLQSPKNDYLSPYDGLCYVKLTELGAFISGKSKQFTPELPEEQKIIYTLDKERLILTMQGKNPIAELSLQKILKPVGTGRYLMTFDSLLEYCQSKKDLQNKISLFKQTIGTPLPTIWQEMFKKANSRINPLIKEPDFIVFKIEESEELLQLLSMDPTINSLISKVEGLRIAVNKTNAHKLKMQLKKHGYLISSATFA